MSGGKAHGSSREYQERCRDVLVHRNPELRPLAGDGIDVPFPLGGTTWSFDVALQNAEGQIVVAECKKYASAPKQGQIASFAYTVERLRKSRNVPVAGMFFTTASPQIGLVKVGQFEGIDVVVLKTDAYPPGFSISFERYDRKRERRWKELMTSVPKGSLALQGTISTLVIAPSRPAKNIDSGEQHIENHQSRRGDVGGNIDRRVARNRPSTKHRRAFRKSGDWSGSARKSVRSRSRKLR
jgi:hypothetical protein